MKTDVPVSFPVLQLGWLCGSWTHTAASISAGTLVVQSQQGVWLQQCKLSFAVAYW